MYRYCWNVASNKWTVHNRKIEIISFVCNVSFLSDPHCQFRGFLLRSNVVLFDCFLCRQLSFVQKITILGTRPRITYELWNVNSIRWWCWNIYTDEREFDYQVLKFVVEFFFFSSFFVVDFNVKVNVIKPDFRVSLIILFQFYLDR